MVEGYSAYIKSLRMKKGFSQSQMAEKLGVSRPSYIAIEQGKRELSLVEAEKLAHVFGITIDEFLHAQVPDYIKYQQMILAYLREAKRSKMVLKKTKLAKLLYLADFAWFYENLESMSGLSYHKLEFGPVPDEYFRALQELEDEGSIIVKHSQRDGKDMYEITESRGSARKPLEALSKKENRMVDKIWNKWKNANTQEIVKFTHEQLPYTFSFEGERIPYELITQEDPEHVY